MNVNVILSRILMSALDIIVKTNEDCNLIFTSRLLPEYFLRSHTEQLGFGHRWSNGPFLCARYSGLPPTVAFPTTGQLSWPQSPLSPEEPPFQALYNGTFLIRGVMWENAQCIASKTSSPLVYATQSISAAFSPASSSASWSTVRITLRWCLAVSPGRNPEKIPREKYTNSTTQACGTVIYPSKDDLTVARWGDVRAPGVWQNFSISDDPHTNLISTALESNHHSHVSGRMNLEDTQNTATQCLTFYSQNQFIYVLMSILQKCKCVFKRFLQFSQCEFTIKVKYVMSGCTYATHAAG